MTILHHQISKAHCTQNWNTTFCALYTLQMVQKTLHPLGDVKTHKTKLHSGNVSILGINHFCHKFSHVTC